MKYLRDLTAAALKRFDALSGTSLKPAVGGIYRWLLKLSSLVRRRTDHAIIRTLCFLKIYKPKELKLNLGCGTKHFKGYLNVDIWITQATDVISDITRLPWPDGSAQIIEAYHVIEHISHTRISAVLKEWNRVLAKNGQLILEMPHFDNAIKEYFNGNEERLMNVFGRQRCPGDTHLFGYNPQRLVRILENAGFTGFTEEQPTGTQITQEPCFRLKCAKK